MFCTFLGSAHSEIGDLHVGTSLQDAYFRVFRNLILVQMSSGTSYMLKCCSGSFGCGQTTDNALETTVHIYDTCHCWGFAVYAEQSRDSF